MFNIPKRYVLVSLGHVGFFMIYALRVNMSVVLVAMVNSTFSHGDTASESECGESSASNRSMHHNVKDGEFNWDQKHQGFVLSAFFYGYLLTQIPGGWLAKRYGGKYVFGIGVLSTSVLTLLTPIAARTHIYLLILLRILEGLGEGVTCPAMHAIMAQWASPGERTRMVMFAYSGIPSGTIIALPICSLLANSTFLGGWPSAFYVFGILGILWFVVWTKYVYNSPVDHPAISYEEKKYITDALKTCSINTKDAKVPWRRIFTSIRVWAIIVAHFSHNWVWYLVLTGLPSYFKQVLNFRLEENGFLSTLPFVTGLMADLLCPVLADYLIRNKFSVTQIRRWMGMIAFYASALCLVVASFTGCDQVGLSVACMVLGTGFLCFNNSGYNVNHIDIAPRFSGLLFGITNTAGSISGCVTPIVTGYFTNNSPTRENYRKVFLLAACVSVVGGTFFNWFVSGVQQPWNDLDDDCRRRTHEYTNKGVELDIDVTVQNNV